MFFVITREIHIIIENRGEQNIKRLKSVYAETSTVNIFLNFLVLLKKSEQCHIFKMRLYYEYYFVIFLTCS